jgi:hypothetical protein
MTALTAPPLRGNGPDVSGRRFPVSSIYAASPALVRLAVTFFAAAALSVLLGLLEHRTLFGASVWAKPAKFFLSISIQSATVAWAMTQLAATERRRRGVRLSVVLYVFCAVTEMAYITLQASRGLPSHFNRESPLYIALYALMGVGAITMLAATGYVGICILRRPRLDASPVLARAAGLGLVLAALLGGAAGAYMSARPGHWVGGLSTDAAGLPIVGWSSTGGDLRVAHFFGLHASQAIALIGWLVSALPPARANRIVNVAGLAWSTATIALFAQAVLGRPLLP